MRILHVVEATIGGVRRHVQTLVVGLHQRQFDVEVACPARRAAAYGDESLVPSLRAAGVPIRPVAMARALNPVADARALTQLTRVMRAGRYDIVHAHSSKAGFLGRLAARAAGVPITIYTPHALAFLGEQR